jgi:hypothetical protein
MGAINMKKVCVSITERNLDWLRAEARRLGVGVSEVLRRTLDSFTKGAEGRS